MRSKTRAHSLPSAVYLMHTIISKKLVSHAKVEIKPHCYG
ncbi:hypothetical protein TcasGA2_TC031883 [Tribolium castaneum]|uniref:Uncharacterized protein n=1 Tax=Tribolium castaneum TaxID=7070 RepID=A0A139W8S7_TRICA|nr:hypothetical protein TcasGA2_TC031883 [Tribolium castaneum]